jgi:chromosomal replication initiation ATPase DnaA
MTTPSQLIRAMCDRFGVEEDDVKSTYAGATILRVRKIAVYVLRSRRGMTYGEIARVLRINKSAVHRLYWRAAKSPDPAAVEFLS